MRLRKIWQFPNPGTSYEDTLTDDPVLNGDWQVIYTTPTTANIDGWVLGDIVPFRRCFYIVSMTSDATTKYYGFDQMLMNIEYDETVSSKRVTVYSNFYIEFTSTITDEDFPSDNQEINWYPYWNSFYWVTRGRLVLKVDPNYDNSNVDGDDGSVASDDPCDRSSPLFDDGAGASL